MAMDAGSVNAAGIGTGLAKEMFDDYSPKLNIIGLGAVVALQQIADLCNSIAQTVVPHIQSNAEITTFIAPADTGLQLSTAIGVPTGPNPALPPAGLPLGIKGSIA